MKIFRKNVNIPVFLIIMSKSELFSFRAKTTCKCAILFHPFDVAVFAVSKILVRVTAPGIIGVVLAPKGSPSTTI